MPMVTWSVLANNPKPMGAASPTGRCSASTSSTSRRCFTNPADRRGTLTNRGLQWGYTHGTSLVSLDKSEVSEWPTRMSLWITVSDLLTNKHLGQACGDNYFKANGIKEKKKRMPQCLVFSLIENYEGKRANLDPLLARNSPIDWKQMSAKHQTGQDSQRGK